MSALCQKRTVADFISGKFFRQNWVDNRGDMTNEVKLRIYVTAIVIGMAFLYVGFIYTINEQSIVNEEIYDNCMNEYESNSLAYLGLCIDRRLEGMLPIWVYLAPYLPAGLLLWLSWLLKPNMRLPIDAYPKRTVIGLVWLGLIAAVYAFFVTYNIAMNVIDKPVAAMHNTFNPMIYFSGWLIAPLLFQHLLAPAEAKRHIRTLQIGLVMMVIVPTSLVVIPPILKIGGIIQ